MFKGEKIMSINIAIDGPAGAGKSTVAKGVAAKLNYIYVDTGALYRALALFAHEMNVSSKDEEGVTKILPKASVELKFIDGAQRVFLNGKDVSEKIRTPEISMGASDISALPPVREFLFGLQRKIARENNVIMDGRDIGTVVLPDADVKIFLTASPEERAERRYKELIEKGEKVEYQRVLDEVNQRDYNDMNRKVSPLKQADDAVLFDTTGMTLEQSVEAVLDILHKKL